jgi:putative SOS response-associated peptidase YedK
VILQKDGRNHAELLRWGLVPWWAKDIAIGNQMINARAETLSEKPASKQLVRDRRCLVLADGFYEWRREGKGKTPMLFKLASGEPFSFAGLWDTWKKPDGAVLQSFTIVTTEPNELVKPIHNRMPVILSDSDAKIWLGSDGGDLAHALSLLRPFPDDLMKTHDVSLLVNNPRNDIAACAAPAEESHDGTPQGLLDLR